MTVLLKLTSACAVYMYAGEGEVLLSVGEWLFLWPGEKEQSALSLRLLNRERRGHCCPLDGARGRAQSALSLRLLNKESRGHCCPLDGARGREHLKSFIFHVEEYARAVVFV